MNKPPLWNSQAISIDLDKYVANGSNDIFYVPVGAIYNQTYGLRTGDLLVVDRNKKPENNSLIICQGRKEPIISRYNNLSFFQTNKERTVKEQVIYGVVTWILRPVGKDGVK